MTKAEIRSKISALKRSLISIDFANDAERDVCRIIEQTVAFQNSQGVLLYYNLPDELPTANMISKWASLGKDIFLPRVNGDDIEILRYDAMQLHKGSYNILEPSGNEIVTDLAVIDIAIIPGVAFDKVGNRLGRGKGFYDRFLRKYNGTKIGVGYGFQLVDSIPIDDFDIPMDIVITSEF